MSSTFDLKDSSNIYGIKALKEVENYSTWCIKMEDILTSLDLWDYAKGTAVVRALSAKEVSDHAATVAAATAANTSSLLPLAATLIQDV